MTKQPLKGIAKFSSPTSASAYSTQTRTKVGVVTSDLSGNTYLPNNNVRNHLTINFNEKFVYTSFTFATAEVHGGPTAGENTLRLTAYLDSAQVAPVGMVNATGEFSAST